MFLEWQECIKEKLCAADYGVPQLRNRLIFMGIREDIGKQEAVTMLFMMESYLKLRMRLIELDYKLMGNMT